MPTGLAITIGHCHVTPLVRVSIRIRGICQLGESWKGDAQSVPIRNLGERFAPEDFGPRPKSDDQHPARAAYLERKRKTGSAYGIRTRVTGVREPYRCLQRSISVYTKSFIFSIIARFAHGRSTDVYRCNLTKT